MNKKILLIFLLIWSFYSCSSKKLETNEKELANSQNPVEERIAFISRNDTLVGYLSKPVNKSKFPVIVVLHSASHGHHDNEIYNHLEKNMSEIGVGVFTYDRRGSGESAGVFETASFEDLANDALATVKILKKREDIDTTNIGLYGISQGGWLGPIAYSLNKKDISFMILASSCGVTPAIQMKYSAITTLEKNGYSDSIISIAKGLINISNEYYRGNVSIADAQRELDIYNDAEWFEDTYLDSQLPEDVGDTKWIREMDFEPVSYFKEVDIPLVLFYGEFDRWVPIQSNSP